jgi:hypothetical protein
LAKVIDMIEIKKSCSELEYVRCALFNASLPGEPIGNIPPAEAEATFYAALETEAMAA